MNADDLKADKEAFVETFIAELLAMLQGAYLVAIENGMTLETIAEGMDATPAEIEDLIFGRIELDLRSLAELCCVMGFNIEFDIIPTEELNRPLIR